MRHALLIATLLLPLAACDLIEGRVESEVAGHHVIVTDCYRSSPPPPERLADEAGQPVHRYAPCKDAIVMLRGEALEVNGTAYGTLGPGDEILVDHGVVSIHRGGKAQRAGH